MLRRLVLAVRRRIAVKLTLTLVGFAAVSALAAGLYIDHALEQFAEEAVVTRLLTVGRLFQDESRALLRAGRATAGQDLLARAGRASGVRITLIDRSGRVVGDSERRIEDLEAMGTLAARPEVAAALAGGAGQDVRTSDTSRASLVYGALPVSDSGQVIGVLRLALPRTEVTEAQASMRGVMLAGGALMLGVAFGIGVFVARRVTRPVLEMQSIARRMSEGDFAVRAPARSPDEIGVLGRSLNSMAARLREEIQDLAQEQAKATAILDAMVEGVIAVDSHDRVLLTNERARVMFGLGPARGPRRSFLEVVRNSSLHEVLRASRRAQAGAVTPGEFVLSAPANLVLQAQAVTVDLEEGTGVVMVLHDITALRHLEQVRTEFVANVSHELRTPLTAIRGYLETLVGGALDEPRYARRFLEIALRHTERLGRLLNDLTDLSNIELGRVIMHFEPTRLEEVVESTLEIVRPKAAAGGVEVRTELAPGLPALHADRDRLAQILLNLVDNAVKFTPAGGWIAVSASASGAGTVEVAVADTGMGIPPLDLPRITERFYRVDKARSRELGGTGLGLAIVKHLVLAHGGELAIDSAVGRGTVVRVTVRAAEGPA
ncbi:MAG TPA: ATP-binding protein [Candidatus Binatia bacterium]|nr:ATP-binding protein [Candidatus Binatia bacterium]